MYMWQQGVKHSRFTRKTILNSHIVSVYKGKKPFKCNVCDRGFTWKWDFNVHKRTVH